MKAKKEVGLGLMMLCFYKLVAKLLAHRTHLLGFCGFQAILSTTAHLSCPFFRQNLKKKGRRFFLYIVIYSLRLLSVRILAKKNGRNFYMKVRDREPVAQLAEHRAAYYA